MRRAPIVVVATAAGVVAVLSFHTAAPGLSAGALPATSGTPQAGITGGSRSGQPASRASSKARPGSAAHGATRTVDGPSVNYSWGVLSVSVTVSGNKITKVGIASLNDGGQARSQLIDQQAIPILEQEVVQAQSANIQGVSGASYTSAGFRQSLQSALHSLGM